MSEIAIDLRAGVIGSVGTSTNPDITKRIMDGMQKLSHPEYPVVCRWDMRASFEGRVPEFKALSEKYSATSPPDLLLCLVRTSETNLNGLQNCYSHLNYGSYAAAIVAHDGLWLFREDVDLHVVDLRETFNQIFFFPKIEMWRQVCKDKEIASYIPDETKIIEMPNQQGWLFSKENPWEVRKYKFTRTAYQDWGASA